MKILEDILSTLDLEAEVKDIRQGLFLTAVLTRRCGLAATLGEGGRCEDESPVKEAGRLVGKKTRDIAEMAFSSSLLEAAMGLAAINSLLEVDETRCTQINARDILVQRGKGKKVAIIGHFPFVSQLRPIAAELWVIEKHPREGDFGESEAAILVPQADVVGITGTTFINHTVENLLRLCRTDAYVIILGPTTPLFPVLFRYGISALSGTKVDDPEVVLRGVSQGATYRQLTGIRMLTMERG